MRIVATILLAFALITTTTVIAPHQAHATWHHHKHKKH